MKALGKLRALTAVGLTVAALLLVTMLVNAFAGIHSVSYSIPSAKLGGRLRLALIADLHGARYGRRQRRLMAKLAAGEPDAVLLSGDIFDRAAAADNAVACIRAISERYPCYFVFGNHEYASGDLAAIRDTLESAGVPILEGDCLRLVVKGESIWIAGVDDVRWNPTGYRAQLAEVKATLAGKQEFAVLMSHEPQFTGELLDTGAELIVSGHTHGGQWSIPGVFNGLYAPGQGFFPKYAGGMYAFGEQRLVISRGLAKTPLWAPRIFTPRELVFLDIGGES